MPIARKHTYFLLTNEQTYKKIVTQNPKKIEDNMKQKFKIQNSKILADFPTSVIPLNL